MVGLAEKTQKRKICIIDGQRGNYNSSYNFFGVVAAVTSVYRCYYLYLVECINVV